MSKTKIEWSEFSWNPVVGCSKVSEGCKNCYAERLAASGRLQQFEQYQKVITNGKWNGTTSLVPHILDKPLHWRKPRMIFVSSMGDLFHDSVSFESVLKIIGIIICTPWHTYQILTKRPERMYDFFACFPDGWFIREGMKFSSFSEEFFALDSVKGIVSEQQIEKANIYYKTHYDQSNRGKLDGPVPFPIPNVWLGVTCENQRCADERIPTLLQIPAAVRFISCEPLLEDININIHYLNDIKRQGFTGYYDSGWKEPFQWVIIGCESGPGRRPCKAEWVRNIVAQCKAAGVKIFIKQLDINGVVEHDINKFPEDLKIREYPIEKKTKKI